MGCSCTKKGKAVSKIAPEAGKHSDPYTDTGGGSTSSYEARSIAQQLPRLKFCGDCGQKMPGGKQPCKRCGYPQIQDQSGPAATLALSHARATDPHPHTAPPLYQDLSNRSSGVAKASAANQTSMSQHTRPKGASKAPHPCLQEPDLRYQSAAWATSLSAPTNTSTKQERKADGLPYRSSLSQSHHGVPAAGPGLRSERGIQPTIHTKGSNFHHPGVGKVPCGSSASDPDANIKGLIGALLSGPVPDYRH